jgi:hypothetical protein
MMLIRVLSLAVLACCLLLVQATVYVNNTQNNRHESQNGSSTSFTSLADAIASLRKPTPRFEQIRILPGYYLLTDKNGILIQGLSLEISGSGTDNTILDCQGHCNALVIVDADISIRGLIIKNCASNVTAGGISATRSNIVVEDVFLENNIGITASGVYLEDSTAKITASRFINSRGSPQSTSLVVRKSKLTMADVAFSTTTTTSAQQATSDLTCANSHLDIGLASDDKSPLPRINSNDCTFGFISAVVPTKTRQHEKRSLEEVTAVSCNNDGKCGTDEDCFSCPKDCGCAFDGYRVESGTGTLSTPSTTTTLAYLNPEFTSYMNGTTGDVYGKAFAYFIVEDSGDYTFQLSTKYMAAEVLIDGKTIISSKLIQPSLKASANIIVQTGYIHNIAINFYANSNNNDRYLSLSWKDSDNKTDVYKLFDKVFYSVNICGDHIDDDALTCPQDTKGNGCETYTCLADAVPLRYTTVKLQDNATVAATCNSTSILSFVTLADCTNGTGGLTQCTTTLSNSTKIPVSCTKVNASVCTSNSPLSCGTGICVERFAEDCFVDCYDHITTPCPSIAPPVGHISPGLPVRDDTFGNLIRNQMLWHLPGIEHVTYGFDIIKGEGATSPLFYFGYCSDTPLQTVQDTYRGNVYTVPAEVYAQPAPRCSFSMDSSTYSSSVTMANEMTDKTVREGSAELGGGFKLFKKSIGANAAAAFTQEKSVEQARELETKQTGSLLTTEVTCSTSKVQVNSYTFHPGFLKDLASVTDKVSMIAMMKKYGTYFYDNVVLGGKLKQVTILDQNFESQRSKDELVQNAQKSFSGTISAPMFSASGSYDESIDSSIKSDQQSKFETSSQRTTVITYGGPPGSFGPALSNAPTNFGDWARSVDKLPVPIDYELRPISDIIPKSWRINYNKCSTSAVDVWNTVEPDYYRDFPAYEQKVKLNKYTLYWTWDTANIRPSSPIHGFPVQNATYYVVISNSGNATEGFNITRPPTRDQKNDFIQIFDQSGPNGTFAPINFYGGAVATQNPIVFDFYSPLQLDTSLPFYTSLYTKERVSWKENHYTSMCPSNGILSSSSPGFKEFYEVDATAYSHIYLHDWTNGLLHSSRVVRGVEYLNGTYGYQQFCTPNVDSGYYKDFLTNATWVFGDWTAAGTHTISFKIARSSGTASPTSLRTTLIGDFGQFTTVDSSFKGPVVNGTAVFVFKQFVVNPAIGPIRELRINIGTPRSSLQSSSNATIYSLSDVWVAAPFCGNLRDNTNLVCDSLNPPRRVVFGIPYGDTPVLSDWSAAPLEIPLRPLSDFNI